MCYAGNPLRPGSHQLNSCEKNGIERFPWIGFVAVTLVWSLLESKERSSLLNSSIHTGCKVFYFHSEDEAIFFFHIYLARVSRLMSKSFDILCISPASTNRNVNKFTKCEHFTASNKCRAVSFNARSSLMFSLIWIGAA